MDIPHKSIEQYDSLEKKYNFLKWAIKKHWYVYLIVLFLAGLIASLINALKTPIFTSHAKIAIFEDNSSTNGLEKVPVIELFNGQSNLDYQVGILNSPSFLIEVVEKMRLNVNIYKSGRLRDIDLYQNPPIEVVIDDNSIKKIPSIKFKATILPGDKIRIQTKTKTAICPLNSPIKIFKPYHVMFAKGPAYNQSINGNFKVVIRSLDEATDNYDGRYQAVKENTKSNIVLLDIKEPDPVRAARVLDCIINSYIKKDIVGKTTSLDTAFQFLNSRINSVTIELAKLESNISKYKNENRLLDYATQSLSILQKEDLAEQETKRLSLQLSIINNFETYLNEHLYSIAPFYPDIKNYPTIIDNISRYNALLQERNNSVTVYKEKNPRIQDMDRSLATLRNELKFGLGKIKEQINTQLNSSKNNASAIFTEGSRLPSKEAGLLDYTRKQNILQDLLVYLLKSREEIDLSRKQIISSVKPMDNPKILFYPINVNTQRVYFIAILFAFIIPTTYLGFRNQASRRIFNLSDINARTELPVIGKINHCSGQKKMRLHDLQLISEQVRFLRSNLFLLLNGAPNKCILVTSSIEGEGKSFTSLNLANSVAMLGKKVLLMELDLRRPAIATKLGYSQSLGFMDMIKEDDRDYSKYIQKQAHCNTLDLITSGTVNLANASDILLQPSVKEFMQWAKQNYEFIILDTPPMGLVSDAQLLSKYADVTLFVMRFGYTGKEFINFANKLSKDGTLKNIRIVLNDININKAIFDDGDMFSQTYGYGYAYYNVAEKSSEYEVKLKKRLEQEIII